MAALEEAQKATLENRVLVLRCRAYSLTETNLTNILYRSIPNYDGMTMQRVSLPICVIRKTTIEDEAGLVLTQSMKTYGMKTIL